MNSKLLFLVFICMNLYCFLATDNPRYCKKAKEDGKKFCQAQILFLSDKKEISNSDFGLLFAACMEFQCP